MNGWIEVSTIAKFKPYTPPEPVKFKVQQGSETRVVVIDRIEYIEPRNASGEEYYRYLCVAMIGDKRIKFYLQYWISTCLWQFKMTG